MPHFHIGATEAECLIRNSPRQVPAFLKRAKRDLRRWSTRLFQADKKRFLEGYIATLEAHLDELRRRPRTTTTTPSIAPQPLSKGADPCEAGLTDTGLTEAGDSGRPTAADPMPVVPEPAGSGPVAETVGPTPPPAPTEIAAAIEPEREPEVVRSPLDRRTDPHGNLADLSNGIWKISGWADGVDPHAIEPTVRGSEVVSTGAQAASHSGEYVAITDWSRVFTPVQGTAIVDLSAYDAIDQLGQLRELLDLWREQNGHARN